MFGKDEKQRVISIKEWIYAALIAVFMIFVIRTFLFEPFVVVGNSMYPSLNNEERMIIDKLSFFIGKPKKGDIIVFKFPVDLSRDFVKRVIATGGDSLEMKDGAVFVNGKRLNETYVWNKDPIGRNHSNYLKCVVPEGTVFVLGDNRNHSADSRFKEIDMVPLKLVKGRVVLIYYPLSNYRSL